MRVCTKVFLSANGLKGSYGYKYRNIVLLLLKERFARKDRRKPSSVTQPQTITVSINNLFFNPSYIRVLC